MFEPLDLIKKTILELKSNFLSHQLKKSGKSNEDWTKDEDIILFKFVSINGLDKWEKCANIFINKTPEKCKERYFLLHNFKLTLCKHCQIKLKQKIKKKIMLKYYELKLKKSIDSS